MKWNFSDLFLFLTFDENLDGRLSVVYDQQSVFTLHTLLIRCIKCSLVGFSINVLYTIMPIANEQWVHILLVTYAVQILPHMIWYMRISPELHKISLGGNFTYCNMVDIPRYSLMQGLIAFRPDFSNFHILK